jgi:uncharacterized protein (DUF1697 family)
MRYVALLRGINVGGNSLVKMAELKAMAEACGLTNVQTYINSGNVIFDSDMNPDEIEKLFSESFQNAFGFQTPIIIRSKTEMAETLKKAPQDWADNNEVRKYLAFTTGATPERVASLIRPKEGVDTFEAGPDVVYLTTKLAGITKSGLSRLSQTEVYRNISLRNVNTVEKIYKLM